MNIYLEAFGLFSKIGVFTALYPLHKLRPKINRQYLAPKLIQPLCDRTAEASKSNYNICFFHGFTPFVCV